MSELTQQRLKERLHYNPKTGTFVWLSGQRAGRIAGCVKPAGYREVKIDGRGFLAHRLVWFYVNGRWPDDEIDHINHNRDDNRIENLREASRSDNMQNKTLDSRNTSGMTGVSLHKTSMMWRAQIMINKKRRLLGYFHNKADAITARQAAEIKYGFHPNHGLKAA